VYSSGSVAAQQQIFGFSAQGDLRALFSGFFDTRVGAKRAAESYGLIARACGLPVAEFLFLSDVAEELDAAATAGMLVCQLVRPQDGTIACGRHPMQADFAGVDGWLRQQARVASPPSATR
jgi:enolase-phosphatase E1